MPGQDDIVMGLMQDDLYERFGPGWSIEVVDHPKPGKAAPGTVVQIRIRHGEVGDGIAANANLLKPHLKLMVEGKCIQEQIYEAIAGDDRPHLYLNENGENTCQHVYENVMENLDHYAWTEQNNPE